MLERFYEEVRELEDVPAFEKFMAKEMEGVGFDRFAYLALQVPDSRKSRFAVTNYPFDWIRYYAENDYVNYDPILGRARRSLEAFRWERARTGDVLTARQKRVLDEGAEFGLAHGAVVPVHGPSGRFAMLALSSQENPREFAKIWHSHWMKIHMMALYYHSAVERNVLDKQRAQACHLTDREREALLWTARGKTAWETSEIMKISQETVNFHFKNVMRKLGVYSKHHAVVKAIMMGLIFP